ncbi:DNA internalization-related competence protein ComEC/Rec2 [Microbulbifer thermotolerans]|uniref:DNA internalization-related competence protein ComEC/Rec2 n=1 Tax=Microbulbifer thermotolerans TaxID=252514 RepID=UPI002248FA7E|nr:DNA internalization-related competence protein ComEC/Rec2 [Microbulbifer thermotolerans]MCX2782306.1 DNA internalization-related competence protein ComEC/Rec2 [Microbulbifer thermotolerans]MCX2831083.1 DNA internalization-related competence protein ComEC/Rec2 [Microbulbifer thermotolerans]
MSPTALLWAYALAIVFVGSLPQLPSWNELATFGVVILAPVLILPGRGWLSVPFIATLLGAGWGLWHNQHALEQRLPLSAHGANFLVEVQVVSLPRPSLTESAFDEAAATSSVRFSVRVLRVHGRDLSPPLQGQLLDLTWYSIDEGVLTQLRGGSLWLLPVRLKPPRGSVNPHGFDYEGWLLRRGVYATGYVHPQVQPPQYLGLQPGIPALRHWLRDKLLETAETRGELLSALLLGDRGGIDAGDQRLLRETGTAHLLAISGLHVGMVTGFFMLVGGLLGRAIGICTGATPRGVTLLFALSASLIYTLLAGAPLSAQRALVMTWVLLLVWQWRRRISSGFAYALALALVLTIQPLAFYGAGFWLSFIAVGALLLGFRGRQYLCQAHKRGGRLLGSTAGLLRSQWLVTVALLLPSLVFFSGFSPGGLLLNLIAIPWLGFLVLPPLMLGVLLLVTPPGAWCINFAAWQLDALMHFLGGGHNLLPSWQILGPPAEVGLLVLSALGAVLLLLPPGLPGRNLGWLLLLPPLLPFLPRVGEGEWLRVTVLDVGQGLAVVVHTPRQRLLYDTGPISGSGWSAGREIIVPYLIGEGVLALDTVVVSHGDRDHAGGFAGLAESLPVAHLIAPGRLERRLGEKARRTSPCVAGGEEILGDLRLRWLWPDSTDITGEENDHSCVAVIEWHGVQILLAGDVPAEVERQLAKSYPLSGPVDLLLAPHHGSRSSSSNALIAWAAPRRVVFSAGFRHHFGHPHPDVVARYAASGAALFSTAKSGALVFTWMRGAGAPLVEVARAAPRFWYADHTDGADAEWRLSRRSQLW